MSASNYPAGVTVADFIDEECPKCASTNIDGEAEKMCLDCDHEWGGDESGGDGDDD